MTEAEKAAYYEGTLDKFGLDEKRVRAVAEFKGLNPHKRYRIEESSVPEGYVLTHPPDQVFEFSESDGNLLINLLFEVKNFRMMDLPTTGGVITLLVTLGAALTAFGLYSFYRRRNGYRKRRRKAMT